MSSQPVLIFCEWASCRAVAQTRSGGYALCQEHALEDRRLHAIEVVGPRPCVICGGEIVRPAMTTGAWAKRCTDCKAARRSA